MPDSWRCNVPVLTLSDDPLSTVAESENGLADAGADAGCGESGTSGIAIGMKDEFASGDRWRFARDMLGEGTCNDDDLLVLPPKFSGMERFPDEGTLTTSALPTPNTTCLTTPCVALTMVGESYIMDDPVERVDAHEWPVAPERWDSAYGDEMCGGRSDEAKES